ncbi:uncharacterized protein LOC106881237 [Octopus bimaculoides]|uniref:Uncharacterized protein n=1 Tax=Octopus bimaculoides TaxID=37653 RepID=A0A0L8FTM8_OCTBM|nr:uncharacterized protein LOC106881237 [Octopus bimaculoides]|eukprot:XP_014787033.1 PREDICTED: uncharacterized protein LOC106881237 [Octopus bimaculoides]
MAGFLEVVRTEATPRSSIDDSKIVSTPRSSIDDSKIVSTPRSSIDVSKIVSKENLISQGYDMDLKKVFPLDIKESAGETVEVITVPQVPKQQSTKEDKKKTKNKKKMKQKERDLLDFQNTVKSYLSDSNKLHALTLQFISWSLYKTGRIVPLFQVLTKNGAYPMTCNQFICGMVDALAPFSVLQLHVLSKWLSTTKDCITLENLTYKIGLMDEIIECSCGYKNLIQNEGKNSFRKVIFDKLHPGSDTKPRLSFSETIFQLGKKHKKFNVTKIYNWITNKRKANEKLKNKIKAFIAARAKETHISLEITGHIQENRYVELHVYFAPYDFIEVADFHFIMLLPSCTMVLTVLDLIQQHTDIQSDAFSLFISFNKFRKNRQPLPKMSTFKECGYFGFCKKHPQKVLLFYDCNIRFKSNFISAIDKYYTINKEKQDH